MLENTLRLWNTVVKLKPEFTIPPSDPDPIHHFSTRNRRSVNNFGSYASGLGTSINSLTSLQRTSIAPAGPSTPRKPSTKNRNCGCACHGPGPSPVLPRTPQAIMQVRTSRFHAPLDSAINVD
ncbi:hypothetical protein B0H19DRAFT_329312 [Mycena capillaripes]|nr:hypothetical protein B0H19DRAFT_329312 [Mycena capillaripes]